MAGGKEVIPAIDEGFIQVRTFEDLDGHPGGILFLERDKKRSIQYCSRFYYLSNVIKYTNLICIKIGF